MGSLFLQVAGLDVHSRSVRCCVRSRQQPAGELRGDPSPLWLSRLKRGARGDKPKNESGEASPALHNSQNNPWRSSMAPFRNEPDNPSAVHPDEILRIDRQLLQNSPVSLYGSRQVLREHVSALETYGYLCPVFECAGWQSEMDMHRAFASRLEFPDYYGHNLDALNDCLSCLNVPVEGGVALVLLNFDRFSRLFPRAAWHILDIIAHASWGHLLHGRRFLGLIQSDDPELRFEPVGAKPVMWNLGERFKPSRGCGDG